MTTCRDRVWLKCNIHRTDPVSVSYEAIAGVYDSDTTIRLQNHLNYLRVAELYACQAINHLADIRHQLVELYGAGGLRRRPGQFGRRARGRQLRRLNSWSTAGFIRGLAESSWFLNGGFGKHSHLTRRLVLMLITSRNPATELAFFQDCASLISVLGILSCISSVSRSAWWRHNI